MLEAIGMRKGWIYEVIVSTYRNGRPHSAPMGVWTGDFLTLNMTIYSGSSTLKSIMEKKDFAVNLVTDVAVFYDSLFNKTNIAYRDSLNVNAPVLLNASTIVEARLDKAVRSGNKFHLESTPLNIETIEPVKPINRAEAIVMESLILATRLPYLAGSKVREALKENHRIVKKVAPGSQYEEMMKKLVETPGEPAPGELSS